MQKHDLNEDFRLTHQNNPENNLKKKVYRRLLKVRVCCGYNLYVLLAKKMFFALCNTHCCSKGSYLFMFIFTGSYGVS